MFLETVSTTLTVLLCLSNVFSTFKTLQQRAEESTFRVELQFWSVYVVGIILTSLVGWFRGDPTTHVQLMLSIVLVLFKHFDTDHAFLSRIFNLARQVMNFLDEHFISPNVEKFLLQPCTQLVDYGVQTLRKSKSISKEDRTYAAASIQRCNALLRGEILLRDRERFSESLPGSSDTAAASPPESPGLPMRRQQSAPAAPQTPKRQPSLTFATLRRYFSEAGVLKSDEEIGQVLKTFQGRDAELRRRLEKKFNLPVGEPNGDVTTPRSAGTIGATKHSNNGLDVTGPFTDNVVLRRRKTTGGLD
eukprot:INCI20301.1.p1 GENE.INCI20301.1~~INCI20301.1.p1  ORF type:complete len:304 (-),score=47.74 INCI20301.1:101-1012(-)